MGSPNGSVFEVAARANNVTYTRECCGKESLAALLARPTATYLAFVVAVAAAALML